MKTYTIRVFFLLLFLLGSSWVSQAQQRIYGVPDMQNYGPKDHNSGAQTWGAVQDDLGRMYFANRAGVITFDGHYWKTIPLANNNTARSIAIDDEGTVYLGGVGEVGYLAKDSLGGLDYVSLIDKISEEDLPALRDMWYTGITDDGVFFVGLRGVFQYKEGRFIYHPMGSEEDGAIIRAWEVNGKIYLLRPDSGLWTVSATGLKLIPGGELAADPNSTGSGLIPWKENEVLYINYTGGTWAFGPAGGRKEEDPRFESMREILSRSFVNKIIPIPGLGYAFNTLDNGAVISDEDFRELYQVNKKSGMTNNAVKDGLIDREGNYWMVTNTGMTYLVVNSPFTYAGERQGIDTNILSAVVRNDSLFLGTAWGVKYETKEGFVQIPDSRLEIWDLDVVNEHLYASSGNWLEELSVDGSRREVVRNQPWGLMEMKSRPGYYILHNSYEHLHALKLVNGKLQAIGPIMGYVGNALALKEDSDGYLWISNGQAPIVRLKINQAMDSVIESREMGVEDGLPSNERCDIVVYEPAGDRGLLVMHQSEYYTWYAEQDTFMRYEPLMIDDRFKHNTFTPTADGTIYTKIGGDQLRYVKTEDGFKIDTLGFGKIRDALVQDVIIGPDSTLLYLSSEGIIQYRPDRAPDHFIPFNTVISKVENDGITLFGSYDFSDAFLEKGLGLDYKNSSLRFSYSALFFEEPEKTTFQFRLEGYDQKWSEWTKEAYKEYTNLSEGAYTFRVRSRNLYGVEGKEAAFSFRVYPPWYRSSLAFGGYGLLLLVLIWVVVRINTYRLIKEKEKLEQIVQERTQEISEQKDEIAAQATQLRDTNQKLIDLGRFKEDMTSMIVHDLKTPLSVIIKTGEKKAASIARKMLNLVLNMLDVQKFEETNVQPSLAHHSVNELVNQAIEQVEGSIAENNIKLEVHATESLGAALDVSLIERVIVNLMSNAIRYAPVNSTLRIELTKNEAGELFFSLTDEGPGISAAKQKMIFDRYAQGDAEIANRSQSTGLGLTFCKMVVEAHGGRIGVSSAPSQGATFWFTLPGANGAYEGKIIQHNAGEYTLTEDDKSLLKAVVSDLRQFKIYQSTAIENRLKQVVAEENSGLWLFIQKLINASYNGDEAGFESLINEVEG